MSKSIIKKLLAAALMCSMLAGTGIAGTAAVFAAETDNQSPVISGTSKIQILKGDTFDTKDVLNRVYAMDYEDGDLTKDIQIVSEDVNTSEAGTYSVVYEVKDKDGGSDQHTTVVEVVDAFGADGQVIQKTLYSKEKADHLLAVDMWRGYHHDRQHLGIYLNAGTSLKVRIANPQEVVNYMYMDIFGDDSDIEKVYTIPYDGSWVTIPATDVVEDMVPFIRTLQSDVQPIIEYCFVEDGMEELTYYYDGDDEEAFFAAWNGNDHQYGVIEGERITMLIPRRDKDSILHNSTTREEYQFKSLDEMIAYFNDLQVQYDEYVGLEYDQNAGVNKNVRAKYFAKADATGVGAAYYSGHLYTAENSESMNGYLKYDWMTMHEVAHGYDTKLTSGDLPLGECINNMIGYFYQRKVLAEGDNGWSSMQNFELVEDYYMEQLEQGLTFNTMQFDARLYCMLNALTVSDPKTMMAELHRGWRADGAKTGVTDFVVESFSNTSGYNLVPYFEEYGIYTSEMVKSRIYEKNYPIVNHFADHFASEAEANAAKVSVGDAVNGAYGLALAEDMSKLNLKGSLKVQIQIDDLEQVAGKEVILMDGEKEIAKAVIEENEISFADLPIGTYRLVLPAARANGYYADYMSVTIANGKEAKANAVYTKNTDNEMKDDAAIVLQGLSDQVFSTVSTMVEEGKIVITTEAIQPHYIFSTPYGQVTIYSQDNKELYHREYIGTETYTYEVEEVEAPVGSKIVIEHIEIGGNERRVKVKSQLLAAICEEYMEGYTANNNQVTFVVTENGIKRADWNDAQFDSARKVVADDMIAFMEKEGDMKEDRNVFQKLKAMVSGMTNTFDENVRAQYEADYPYIYAEEVILPPMPTPEPIVNPFTDVARKDYYYNPVLWAVSNNVTTGLTPTVFGSKEECTRGQIVTFLWRAFGEPEVENRTHTFADVVEGKYYYDAVLWAVEQGITTGLTKESFGPNETCTRGQIVTFLWRALGNPEAQKKHHTFTDVTEGKYYYDAMLWAVEDGVTSGYTSTTFAPNATVTRCETVTFLYRALAENTDIVGTWNKTYTYDEFLPRFGEDIDDYMNYDSVVLNETVKFFYDNTYAVSNSHEKFLNSLKVMFVNGFDRYFQDLITENGLEGMLTVDELWAEMEMSRENILEDLGLGELEADLSADVSGNYFADGKKVHLSESLDVKPDASMYVEYEIEGNELRFTAYYLDGELQEDTAHHEIYTKSK